MLFFPWLVNHQLVCKVWVNNLDSWLASAEIGLHAVNNVAETEFRQIWDLYDFLFPIAKIFEIGYMDFDQQEPWMAII